MAHPARDGLVTNFFVDLGLWLVLLVLEPVLLLVATVVARRRLVPVTR